MGYRSPPAFETLQIRARAVAAFRPVPGSRRGRAGRSPASVRTVRVCRRARGGAARGPAPAPGPCPKLDEGPGSTTSSRPSSHLRRPPPTETRSCAGCTAHTCCSTCATSRPTWCTASPADPALHVIYRDPATTPDHLGRFVILRVNAATDDRSATGNAAEQQRRVGGRAGERGRRNDEPPGVRVGGRACRPGRQHRDRRPGRRAGRSWRRTAGPRPDGRPGSGARRFSRPRAPRPRRRRRRSGPPPRRAGSRGANRSAAASRLSARSIPVNPAMTSTKATPPAGERRSRSGRTA